MPNVLADTAATRPWAQFVQSQLGRWRTVLQQLIRIPSCFGQEHAIVDWVEAHLALLAALGVTVERIAHDPDRLRVLPTAQPPISDVPGRASLVARLPGSGGGRSLVINTHLDIVPAGEASQWRHDPFAGHIDATRNVIYGRGAMDDKAGVAISLALLETLARGPARPAGDVLFHYVLEDEITGNGTLLCLSAGHRADAALILDGTRKDKAINEHAGNLQCRVQLIGKPASVSVSHMGVNAAEMLARLVLGLRDAFFALNAGRREPWTRFPSPYQLVVQSIHSEGSQLTVPDTACAQLYLTFPPPMTIAGAKEFLAQKVAEFARGHDLPAPPQLGWAGFAAEPVRSPASPLEGLVQASAQQLGLSRIDIGPSTGTSDLRHFVAAGMPCLLYGPGAGFNPHRPDEHYHLDDMPTMILLYLDVIRSWCGGPHSTS